MYREQNGLFLVSINIARFIYLLAVTSDVVWQKQILIFNTNVYTYMWKKSKIYSVCIVKNVMFGVLIFWQVEQYYSTLPIVYLNWNNEGLSLYM